MRYHHILLSVLLSWSICQPIRGDFVLGVVGDLNVSPGQTQVVTMTLSSTTIELITSWQLLLRVVPQPGASGTVAFAAPSEPTNYALDGVNFGLQHLHSTSASPNDQILVFDFDGRPGAPGVEVPALPDSRNLVTLNLTASNDAVGPFSLVAVPGVGNTEISGVTLASQEFANVIGGAPILLSQLTAVPEPAGWQFFVLLFIFLGARKYVPILGRE